MGISAHPSRRRASLEPDHGLLQDSKPRQRLSTFDDKISEPQDSMLLDVVGPMFAGRTCEEKRSEWGVGPRRIAYPWAGSGNCHRWTVQSAQSTTAHSKTDHSKTARKRTPHASQCRYCSRHPSALSRRPVRALCRVEPHAGHRNAVNIAVHSRCWPAGGMFSCDSDRSSAIVSRSASSVALVGEASELFRVVGCM